MVELQDVTVFAKYYQCSFFFFLDLETFYTKELIYYDMYLTYTW